MEDSFNIPQLLERIMYPAFLVESGNIVYANHSALQHLIPVDSPVSALITIGADEYAQYTGGTLCLTLSVCNAPCSATVVRDGKFDIFYLDSPVESPELRAYALAAQYLREPLSNAMNTTGLLAQDTSASNPQLEKLNRNLYQLYRTLCNMSDAAQFEEPRPSRMSYSEMTALFTEFLEKSSQLVDKCGRKLSSNVPRTPIHALADNEKIERAVYNLISNALKYTPEDGVIETDLSYSNKKLYFTVQNHCADSVDPNIFSNFMRQPGFDNSRSGLGLGLTIVRKAASAHGGTLLLQQTEDGGIRFTMSLEAKPPEGAVLRNSIRLPVDYAGGYDHALVELSDILPPELYEL